MRFSLSGVFLIILFLIGCSDLGDIQKNMIENNQRVENALTNYEKVLVKGDEVKEEILEHLKTESDLIIIPELLIRQESMENINQRLTNISNKIVNYREDMILIAEEYEDSGQEYNGEVSSIEEIVDTSITVHYFLDETKGIIEQMFLIELPNGYTDSITIFWIGGEYIDVKEDWDN